MALDHMFRLPPGFISAGDVIAPSVTLTSNASDPVIAAFTLTCTFSEDVTGFVVGDITVTNGSASAFTTVSASVYTATITPTAMGTVAMDVNAGVCTDLAGNPNTAATQLSYSYVGTNLLHYFNLNSLSRLFTDSAKTTPVTGDNDPVGAWVDQVVAADEIAQATASAKPTYRASVAGFNNQAALFYDGGDLLQGAFTAAITQPITHFIVAQWTVGAAGVLIDGGDGSNRNAFYQIAGPKWRINAGTNLDTGGASDTSVHIFCIVYNGASSGLWVDGVSASSGNAGAQGIDTLTSGGNFALGNFLTGYKAEHLIYSANLSVADKNTVQNYLAAKFNISVTAFS